MTERSIFGKEKITLGSFEINKKFLGNSETFLGTLGKFEIILKNVGIIDISLIFEN